MIPRHWIAGAVLTLCAATATATDLLQVWEATRQHDPQGAVVEASRAAGRTRQEQAAALWRPAVGLSASTGWSTSESQMSGAQFQMPGSSAISGASFATSVTGGTALQWTVGARQALYNAERRAQQRQLEIGAQAAELEWQYQQQEWMLQTSQRYFDWLLVERRLALLQRQQQAVEKALTEAQDRFALGDVPITDTHEAQARARQLQSMVLAAKHDVTLVRQALQDSSGLDSAQLQPQEPKASVVWAPVAELQFWLNQATQHNPMLRLQQAQAAMASQAVQQYTQSGAPTVEAVAQASRQRLSGSGDFGSASNTQTQHMLGVSLNVPLYTGGWRDAKLEEALQLQTKAQAQVEQARLQIEHMTRAAWLTLENGQSRLQALQAAQQASQARLDATRVGRQVGHRTTLDLLNAENDASAAELAVLQTQVDILQSHLRLEAMAGQLNITKLQAVNAALQH